MAKQRKARTGTKSEWFIAVVGAAVTLATIGFLVYEGITDPPGGAPDLTVEADSLTAQGSKWVVRIQARNAGSETAASVRIVGELRSDSGVVETSEMTLDYVPEESSRTGALVFTHDPSGLDLEVRPTGYERP